MTLVKVNSRADGHGENGEKQNQDDGVIALRQLILGWNRFVLGSGRFFHSFILGCIKGTFCDRFAAIKIVGTLSARAHLEARPPERDCVEDQPPHGGIKRGHQIRVRSWLFKLLRLACSTVALRSAWKIGWQCEDTPPAPYPGYKNWHALHLDAGGERFIFGA